MYNKTMRPTQPTKKFSIELEKFMKAKKNRTIHEIESFFGEKSLAITILILMAVPALPIPTGGITHIFEIIAFLMAAQITINRTKIWLPKRLSAHHIKTSDSKTLTGLLKFIRFFERFSKKRYYYILKSPVRHFFTGLLMMVLIAFAFFSPPFSGLDTLPSLGTVIIALGIILEDFLLVVIGSAIGLIGSFLTVVLGDIIIKFFRNFI